MQERVNGSMPLAPIILVNSHTTMSLDLEKGETPVKFKQLVDVGFSFYKYSHVHTQDKAAQDTSGDIWKLFCYLHGWPPDIEKRDTCYQQHGVHTYYLESKTFINFVSCFS